MSEGHVRNALNKLIDRFYDAASKDNDFKKISKLYCYLENELENKGECYIPFRKGELIFIGGNCSLIKIKKENNPIIVEIPFNMEMKEQCKLSLSFKCMANEIGVPVIVIIKDVNEEEMLNMFRYSAYGQDSDQMIFICDEYVNVMKNRNGKTGKMTLNDYTKENK